MVLARIGCAIAFAFAVPVLGQERFHDDWHHWSLVVPEGWSVVDADAVAEARAVTQETLGTDPLFTYVAGFSTDSSGSLVYPYALVQVSPPADLSRVPWDVLESSLMQGLQSVDSAKDRLAGVVDDIAVAPTQVDRAKRRIMHRMSMQVPGVGTVHAALAAMIGRAGVVQLNFYAPEPGFSEALPAFMRMADSFEFDAGYWYHPPAVASAPPRQSLAVKAIAGAILGAGAVVVGWLAKRLWPYWVAFLKHLKL